MTRGDWVWCVGWAVASSLYCMTAAARLSATFDEPLYVARGLECWRTDSHRPLLRLGTMPLPADLQTSPLFLRERWSGVTYDPATDVDHLLPLARAMTLLFWLLLLAYGWLAGRDLAGASGGRLAVALLACEPSLLAHASLATTDVAVSAWVLALAYHFRGGRDAAWPRRVVVPAICFAAAVVAKASALAIAPLCLVAIEIERILDSRFRDCRKTQTHPLRRCSGGHGKDTFVRDFVWILAVGLVLVFLFCGSDWDVEPSFVEWAHGLPDTALGRSAVWFAEHLRIFSNAGEGIVRQVRHNLRGHGAFLLGRSYPRAVWYYFPAVMSIKLSEPLLFAPLLALALNRRALGNWAMLCTALLLLYSLTFRVQLGIRMVLPLVVLEVVAVAAALVSLVAAADTTRYHRFLRCVPLVAVAWTAFSAALVWPDPLTYVNRFWGGPVAGYRLVSDSNYDWGQGLKQLRQWVHKRQLEKIDVWYFGTDPMVHEPPFRLLPLHLLPIREPGDVLEHTRGSYLAVGTTLLYGTPMNDAQRAAAEFLRARQPVGRTDTFLIYDFTVARDS